MPKNDPPKEHRFKPGQSGNPKGRPKGTSITARLKRIMEQDDGNVAEALAKAATKAALKGDYRFWKEIIDRIDGKVPDKVQSDGEILIRVNHVKDKPVQDNADDD